MTDEIPEGLVQESLKALEIARNTGKIRRGTNEATKQIERGEAKLIYIAGDVQPPEIVAHLPALCKEKSIPYIHVSTKLELGKASGIEVPCASVAILDLGSAKKQVSAVVEKLNSLRKGKAPKAEEKKPEEKKEAKKEEPKAEEKKPEPKAEKKAEIPKEAKPEKKEAKAEKKPEEKKEAKAEKKPEEKKEAKKEEPKAEEKKPEPKAEKKAEIPKEAKPEKKEAKAEKK